MTKIKDLLVVYPFGDALDPKGSGGQNRVFNLATQLNKNNNITIFEPDCFLSDNGKCPQIKAIGFRWYIPPFLTDFNISFHLNLYRILKKEKIDLIHIAFPAGIISAKFISKLLRLNVPVVYDAQSVAGIIVKNTTNPILPFYKRIGGLFYIPFLERLAVKFANHVISVSREDRDLFIKKYNVNPVKISVIPSGTNILSPDSLKEKNRARKEFGFAPEDIIIIFHGIYTYLPNKEAIDLITSYIAPEIKKLYHNVRFIIAGKDVPNIEKGNVKYIGFVNDLHSLLSASNIAIVPLLRGGGTKMKILDYLSIGLPIVTTKKGIEGIEAEDGEHVIIVDAVNKEFVEAIEHLIENEGESKRLGRNARMLAEKEYDWDKSGKLLNRLYSNLINKRDKSKRSEITIDISSTRAM